MAWPKRDQLTRTYVNSRTVIRTRVDVNRREFSAFRGFESRPLRRISWVEHAVRAAGGRIDIGQLPADGERIFVRMQTWKGVFAAELVVGCLQCGLPAQGTARSSGTTDVHGAHDGAIDEAQADETSDAAGAPDVTLGVGDPDDGSVGGSYDASVVDHLSESGRPSGRARRRRRVRHELRRIAV